MSRDKGSKPLELRLEDSEELDSLCDERSKKRVQLGHILLRYAMARVEDAIREDEEMGARRTRKRRGIVRLRPKSTSEG